MKELIDNNVLRKDPDIPNLYRFNPDIIVQGSEQKRRAILTIYRNLDDDNEEMTLDEEKLAIEQSAKMISEIANDSDIIDIDVDEEQSARKSGIGIIGALKARSVTLMQKLSEEK